MWQAQRIRAEVFRSLQRPASLLHRPSKVYHSTSTRNDVPAPPLALGINLRLSNCAIDRTESSGVQLNQGRKCQSPFWAAWASLRIRHELALSILDLASWDGRGRDAKFGEYTSESIRARTARETCKLIVGGPRYCLGIEFFNVERLATAFHLRDWSWWWWYFHRQDDVGGTPR